MCVCLHYVSLVEALLQVLGRNIVPGMGMRCSYVGKM